MSTENASKKFPATDEEIAERAAMVSRGLESGFGMKAEDGAMKSAFSSSSGKGLSGVQGGMNKFKKVGRKVVTRVQVTNAFASAEIFKVMQKEGEGKWPCLAFTFHPHKRFHTFWDLFILLLVFYSSFAEPFKVAFVVDGDMKWYEICIDLAFYIDIILNFWTGVDRGYEIETDKKAIAKDYISFWFWIDIMATIEWDLIVTAVQPDAPKNIIRLIRLIKVARLARASRLINRLTASWTINTGFIEATKFLVYVLICAHWLASFFYFIPNLFDAFEGSWVIDYGLLEWKDESWEGRDAGVLWTDCLAVPEAKCEIGIHLDKPDLVETRDQYVKALYWSLTTMTTIGYGDIGPSTQDEIFYVLIAEILGLAFFAVLLEQINKLYTVLGKQGQASIDQKNDVVSFLKANMEPADNVVGQEGIGHISEDLIDRVITFLNFVANSTSGANFSDDDERFAALSHTLKRKIRVSIFYPTLMKCKMFGYEESVVAESERVFKLFEDTDEDGGGSLDEDEIAKLISGLGMELSKAQVQGAIKEMDGDEDADGTIEVAEFEAWWFLQKYGCPKIMCPPMNVPLSPVEFPTFVPFIEEMAYMLDSTPTSPGDIVVPAGFYGDRLHIVLSGKVTIPQMINVQAPERTRDIEGTDREPAFGFPAALAPQDRALITSDLSSWRVEAMAFTDVAYITADVLQGMFARHWPEGPSEFLAIAKTRYTFSDEILTSPSKRVPSGPAAPWRNSESSEQDLKLMELENSMASKMAAIEGLVDGTMSALEAKLDKLIAAKSA